MNDIEQESSIDEQGGGDTPASLMTDSSPNDIAGEEDQTEVSEAPIIEEAKPEEAQADGSDDVVLADDLIYEKDEEPVKIVSPYDRPGKWYVVHTQSGYENKVQGNLAQRTKAMNKEDYIHEVVIPLENVVEFKQGKRVEVQKKMFPGYILVRARMNDEVWSVIRNTPGITGFVGAGNKPTPLPRKEVENFLSDLPVKLYDFENDKCIIVVQLEQYEHVKQKLSSEPIISVTSSGKIRLVRERMNFSRKPRKR